MKIKKYFKDTILTVVAFIIISIFSSKSSEIDTSFLQTSLANIQTDMAMLEAQMPKFGYAFIKRVVNKTKYPLEVRLIETIHDKLPNNTIVRLKSKDPELGADGKYYRVKKFEDGTYTLSPTETDPKRASRFQVFHKLTRNLTDWLGFAYAGEKEVSGESISIPSETFLCFDETKELVAVSGTKKEFLEENGKNVHWKLISDTSLTNAMLINRTTQDPMWRFKGQRSIQSGIISHPINEVWGIRYITETKKYTQDADQTIKFGDKVNIHVNDGGTFHLAKDWGYGSNRSLQNVTIKEAQGGTPNRSVLYGDYISFHIAPNRFSRGGALRSRSDAHVFFDPFYAGDNEFHFHLATGNGDFTYEPLKCGDFFKLFGKYRIIKAGRNKDLCGAKDEGNFEQFTILPRGKQTVSKTEIVGSELFKKIDSAPQKPATQEQVPSISKNIQQIAIVNPDVIWGISINNKLMKWNGSTFSDVGLGLRFKHVAADPISEMAFLIDANTNGIYQCTKTGNATLISQQLDQSVNVVELAVINQNTLWARDINNILYFYGGRWDTKGLVANKKVISLTTTSDNYPRVITEDRAVFDYDGKQWYPIQVPDNEKLKKVSGNYGISENKNVYCFNNTKKRWEGPIATGYDDVFAAIGFTTEKIFKTFNLDAATAKKESSVAKNSNDPQKTIITIEIEKLGDTAGQIGSGAASSFEAIPADKSPNLIGFAETIAGPFSPGQVITLPAMANQGGAYIEESFQQRGSLSIVANTKDNGDLQLLFSDGIKNDFIYKAIIGGSHNSRSTIIKRTYEGLKPVDSVVAENATIVTDPGSETVYWISYDNGKIKVGKVNSTRKNPGGNYIGEGTFMTWIDPNPAKTPTRVAVATGQKEILCSYVRITGDPVIVRQAIKETERNPEAFNIKKADKIPFRVHDYGSISFTVTGDAEQAVFLEKSKNADYYYLVVFGEGEHKNISVYKGFKTTRNKPILIPCATVSGKDFPDVQFSKNTPKEFWISYKQGTIIVGVKSSELLIYSDLDVTKGIDSFRFFSQKSTTITKIRISNPAEIVVDRNLNIYSGKQGSSDIYDGKFILLTPFDWKFNQDEEVLTCYDNVSNQGPARIEKMIEPGAFYDFNIEIQENGMPQIMALKDPTNPTKVNFDRQMLALAAETTLKRKEAELITKSGSLEAGKIKSESDADKKKTDAAAERLQGKAEVKESLGLVAGDIAGKLGQGGTIAQACATGMSTAAVALALSAQGDKYEAVGVKYSGDMAAANRELQAESIAQQSERTAAIREAEATILEAKASALQGFMDKLAINGKDVYVYLENISRPSITESQLPEEIKTKKSEFLALLTQIEQMDLRNKDLADDAVINTIKLLLDVDHYYLIQEDKVRQRIKNLLENIYDNIKDEKTLYRNLIDLFFAAHNNPFLIDESEVTLRRLWLSNIRKMATSIIKECTVAKPDNEFKLRNSFGEYVSLGKLPKTSEALVSFEVETLNDLFFCFARSNDVKIRNSNEDIYEFDLDGWEGTRSVLRINSLGVPVSELYQDQQLLSSQDWTRVWFNLYQGYVCMGTGNPEESPNPVLAWQDPYPTKNLQWAMVGCWNSPILIRKIEIKNALPITATSKPTQKKQAPVKAEKPKTTPSVKPKSSVKSIVTKTSIPEAVEETIAISDIDTEIDTELETSQIASEETSEEAATEED